MAPNTPTGAQMRLVADAVIRRLDADSRGQDQVRAGRPSDGHAPMDVDNPRNGRDSHTDVEGAGTRPPQRPPPSSGGGAFPSGALPTRGIHR
eukprot:6281224-Pyramimonas_sp.AAC.1